MRHLAATVHCALLTQTVHPSITMVLFRLASALAAASMLAMAAADSNAPTATVKNPITTPTVTLAASKIVDIGCFQTGIPLENHGPYLYRSPGNCQLVCLEQGKNVMGLSDGENCWCGDKIPAKEWATDNKTCDTTCSGDNTVRCTCLCSLDSCPTNKMQAVDPTFSGSHLPVTRGTESRPTFLMSARPWHLQVLLRRLPKPHRPALLRKFPKLRASLTPLPSLSASSLA